MNLLLSQFSPARIRRKCAKRKRTAYCRSSTSELPQSWPKVDLLPERSSARDRQGPSFTSSSAAQSAPHDKAHAAPPRAACNKRCSARLFSRNHLQSRESGKRSTAATNSHAAPHLGQSLRHAAALVSVTGGKFSASESSTAPRHPPQHRVIPSRDMQRSPRCCAHPQSDEPPPAPP
jgi:hypothetical protein